MQLKQESNTEPRKKFHMIRRLRKAAAHATALDHLCESPHCGAILKLEAQAYAAWMNGVLKFELQDWKAALESLSKAQTIYEKLEATMHEDDRDIYRGKLMELQPSLRFCAYNIGDESAAADLVKMREQGCLSADLLTDIDELLAQTREKQAATLSEVTWRGRTVPLKQEKVSLCLVSVQEGEAMLEKAENLEAKLSIYDNLLAECKDALQILKDELRNDPSFSRRVEGSAVSSLHYLHSYVSFLRLTKTVERSRLLIESLQINQGERGDGKQSKPQDFIRLYEVIMQSLTEMQQLPGIEEDLDTVQQLSSQILAYKAFRAHYMAEALFGAKKWLEAMGMYQRAKQHAQGALRDKIEDELKKKLEDFLLAADAKCMSAHAYSIAGDENVSQRVENLGVDASKPLIDRMDYYYEDSKLLTKNPNLVKFPPDFQPIPCKPLFFDLALNHIQFPSLEDKLEAPKEGSKTGISGFVRGLWGWGGSKK
ncbi:unnamed protein product [Darwinula stevensoni]|nr:unnamed protein product [Darwinula stevensoni]CAG0878865.1 unnamed protein product [Darwinula stevensoni]